MAKVLEREIGSASSPSGLERIVWPTKVELFSTNSYTDGRYLGYLPFIEVDLNETNYYRFKIDNHATSATTIGIETKNLIERVNPFKSYNLNSKLQDPSVLLLNSFVK